MVFGVPSASSAAARMQTRPPAAAQVEDHVKRGHDGGPVLAWGGLQSRMAQVPGRSLHGPIASEGTLSSTRPGGGNGGQAFFFLFSTTAASG